MGAPSGWRVSRRWWRPSGSPATSPAEFLAASYRTHTSRRWAGSAAAPVAAAPADTAAAPTATALPAGVVLPPAPVLASNVETVEWAAQEIEQRRLAPVLDWFDFTRA